MKRNITPKDYKAWYHIWRNDGNPHMGNHFCEHFRIDDEELKNNDNYVVAFQLMNKYLLCGWENDISTDNSSLSE